jgi:glycosyltransferase involved in cell wall biosynthesis
MQEINIVHFTSGHLAKDVRIFQRECTALVEEGYNVTLIVRHPVDECVNGIEIKGVKPVHPSRLQRLMLIPLSILIAAIKTEANIYHFHDTTLIPIGLVLSLMGRKVVYDIHENFPLQVLGANWIPKLFRKVLSTFFEFIELSAAKYFSAVVCAEENIAERFRNYSKEIVVLRNYPLVSDFFVKGKQREVAIPPYIVNFGGLAPGRVAKEIVTAIGMLSSTIDFRVLIGGGVDSAEYQNEISQLFGWKRVRYLGKIYRNEMIEIMSKATAALVLYSTNPNNFDLRSNRFYESLAAGLPVITSNFPKWQEVVEKNNIGICVDPSNPKQIATAIEFFLYNPELAKKMGEEANNIAVAQYDWNSEKHNLLKLYQNILLRG